MATASDNFVRSDNADLGADWTPQTANALNLGTNAARANAAGDPAGEYNNTITPSATQFSEVTLTADIDNTLANGLGPAVYMATSADTSYWVAINTNASGRFQLFRRNAGSQSGVLASYTGAAPANGDVVRLEAAPAGSDTDLRVLVNDVERITFTDTSGSKLTSGRVGLFGVITNVVARVAPWSGGDSLAVALTGTITATATEAQIVAGGKTIILTVTADTWIPA